MMQIIIIIRVLEYCCPMCHCEPDQTYRKTCQFHEYNLFQTAPRNTNRWLVTVCLAHAYCHTRIRLNYITPYLSIGSRSLPRGWSQSSQMGLVARLGFHCRGCPYHEIGLSARNPHMLVCWFGSKVFQNHAFCFLKSGHRSMLHQDMLICLILPSYHSLLDPRRLDHPHIPIWWFQHEDMLRQFGNLTVMIEGFLASWQNPTPEWVIWC